MATPHYPSVPDNWKHPFGPYRQAPPEFGGEWWLVSPWNSNELTGMVWEKEGQPIASDPPADFTRLFGPKPHIRDPFYGEWKDNLPKDLGGNGYFKGIKLPEWLTQQEVDFANQTYRAWDMGDMVVYEGRRGFSARWPDSKEYDFDWDAWSATLFPHVAITTFQERLVEEGKKPTKWHPRVPDHIKGESSPQ